MPHFRNKTIRGQEYDLSHLEPFTFALDVDDRTYRVAAEFSSHCFTEALTAEHTPDLRYAHGGETRAFNVERYGLSRKLPDIIRTLGTRSVYHSERETFFVLRDQEFAGGRQPYLIFFSTFTASAKDIHVHLRVRSAYLKPGMSRFAAPIRFSTLVRATAEGRKPKMGRPVQVKRK